MSRFVGREQLQTEHGAFQDRTFWSLLVSIRAGTDDSQLKMKSFPKVGTTGEFSFVVGLEHTITFSGDGMPAVLSTPQLIAVLEQTARKAVAHCLDPNEQTVGMEIDIRHLAPTPPGHRVTCTARVIHAEDRTITFQIEARDTRELIARGIHKRGVIRVESFARRVASKNA